MLFTKLGDWLKQFRVLIHQSLNRRGSVTDKPWLDQHCFKISKCLQKNEKFLRQLYYSRQSELSKILQKATKDNIDALVEIILNIRLGNVNIDKTTFKALKTDKTILEQLCKKSLNLKEKKRLLCSKKRIISKVFTPFLTATGGITGRVICNSLGI